MVFTDYKYGISILRSYIQLAKLHSKSSLVYHKPYKRFPREINWAVNLHVSLFIHHPLNLEAIQSFADGTHAELEE